MLYYGWKLQLQFPYSWVFSSWMWCRVTAALEFNGTDFKQRLFLLFSIPLTSTLSCKGIEGPLASASFEELSVIEEKHNGKGWKDIFLNCSKFVVEAYRDESGDGRFCVLPESVQSLVLTNSSRRQRKMGLSTIVQHKVCQCSAVSLGINSIWAWITMLWFSHIERVGWNSPEVRWH